MSGKSTNKRIKKGNMKSGYLYLIEQEQTGFFKIGVSINPEKRLNQLKTSSPTVLKLITKIYTNDMYTLEKLFHKLFLRKNSTLSEGNKWRNNREWFFLNSNDINYIKSFKKNVIFEHKNKTLLDYYKRMLHLYYKFGGNRYN